MANAIDELVRVGVFKSKGEARQMIKNGGVSIIPAFHENAVPPCFMDNSTESEEKMFPVYDRDKMEVSWTDAVDEKMMFDPDTCEMVHTSLEVHTMSVARAHIDSLCEYVANHKPDVVTKYGQVTLTIRYSGGWSNDTEHLCDKKLKSISKDFLPKSLSKLIDIVPPNLDLVGESLSLHDDRKYPRYDFTALLKVPRSEFYAKFKRFSNDEDQYYPKFKIVDTELKKIYFDKEDLNK